MKIVQIYPPFLYSIQYEDADENEFDRLLQEWNDVECIVRFMHENKELLAHPVWLKISEPEDAARQVLKEAEHLEMLLEYLCKNAAKGSIPNLDNHFHYLEGRYEMVIRYEPMKSYGTGKPSLLRMYAIKLESNTYLITGGGIKLANSIQNSPDLKDHVLQNIDRVRSWLKRNGILDGEDMNE